MTRKGSIYISTYFLLSGCVYTPPGPTVSNLKPGSDAAYLNASRGSADAQITRDQAEQYERQRQQIIQEMELEQLKRQQSSANFQDTVNTIRSIRGLFR